MATLGGGGGGEVHRCAWRALSCMLATSSACAFCATFVAATISEALMYGKGGLLGDANKDGADGF